MFDDYWWEEKWFCRYYYCYFRYVWVTGGVDNAGSLQQCYRQQHLQALPRWGEGVGSEFTLAEIVPTRPFRTLGPNGAEGFDQARSSPKTDTSPATAQKRDDSAGTSRLIDGIIYALESEFQQCNAGIFVWVISFSLVMVDLRLYWLVASTKA